VDNGHSRLGRNIVRFYLASASPARLSVLRAAGLEPIVVPSAVDEAATVKRVEATDGPLCGEALVRLLAQTKAESVIADHAVHNDQAGTRESENAFWHDSLVFGGDSAFVIDGVIYGKPHTAAAATARLRAQRGRTGTLYSGHWLVRLSNGRATAAVGGVSQAKVTFADDTTDSEIDAYVATGEPLEVAGAFTIDGLGAAFVSTIEGNPSTVVGLSVPLLRTLARETGVEWHTLWHPRRASDINGSIG
jgi:septum formation protein